MTTTTSTETEVTLTTVLRPVLFPNGGCDTHHHIFEPEEFTYDPDRHLTPPAAPITAFVAFKERLGITHSVLTHGLSYGSDCTSLKAFVPRLGTSATKAIGVIDPSTTSDEEMLSMHSAGVRGLRVNLYRYAAMEDVELQKVALVEHARRITRLHLPWCLTMTTIRTHFWDELAPFIEDVLLKENPDIKFVTDHFALMKGASMLHPSPSRGPSSLLSQPGFSSILSLMRKGVLYVKLSAPYRVSELAPSYSDLEPLVRAFVDANPHHVLWGSDWPHTPHMKVRTREEALQEAPYLEVDDEAWLWSLKGWLSDEEWELCMNRNPRELIGY